MALERLYLAILLLSAISIASAAPQDDYRITYTIDVKDDGTAIWNVEYRTLLETEDDFDSFENYTGQIKTVYLNEFISMMNKSASEAAIATSRSMLVGDFKGDAAVQSTPTGTYGVVHYSFTWSNFAGIIDSNINIGDAFVGGLYLSRDNSLIIQYPSGYTVEQVIPQPDQVRDGLIWYGLRSFGAGEPRIVLVRTLSSWIPLIVILLFIIAAVAFVYMRRIRAVDSEKKNIAETDLMDMEDRIIKLLKECGGSLYQSEIGRRLGLPKSTVSSALNELYNKNIIQKIRKGRENMIRLV